MPRNSSVARDISGIAVDALSLPVAGAITAATAPFVGPFAPILGYFGGALFNYAGDKIVEASFPEDRGQISPAIYIAQQRNLIRRAGSKEIELSLPPSEHFENEEHEPFEILRPPTSVYANPPFRSLKTGKHKGAFSFPNTKFNPEVGVAYYDDIESKSYYTLQPNAAFGTNGFVKPRNYQQNRTYSAMTEFPVDNTIAKPKRKRTYKNII